MKDEIPNPVEATLLSKRVIALWKKDSYLDSALDNCKSVQKYPSGHLVKMFESGKIYIHCS